VKILILDEDSASAEAIASYFATRGHDPEFASELETAESLLSSHAFDALITDVHLTSMRRAEGLTLASLIRDRALETRVLVVTAFDSREVRAEAARVGAEHFLVKPVSLERMAALLDGEPVLAQRGRR
jgi:DNA-binding response OmpR family regulator